MSPVNFLKEYAFFFYFDKIKNMILAMKIRDVILYLMLIYSCYHLIRDILSDLFGIHHPLIDIFHRESASAKWCGKWCKWHTFPIEIFYTYSPFFGCNGVACERLSALANRRSTISGWGRFSAFLGGPPGRSHQPGQRVAMGAAFLRLYGESPLARQSFCPHLTFTPHFLREMGVVFLDIYACKFESRAIRGF